MKQDGGHLNLRLPGIAASGVHLCVGLLLQAFRDVAARCSWEDAGSKLVLRAVCALPAGVSLTGESLLLGADAEQLLLTDGPEAVAHAECLGPGACQAGVVSQTLIAYEV